jgi:hypothetical protein
VILPWCFFRIHCSLTALTKYNLHPAGRHLSDIQAFAVFHGVHLDSNCSRLTQSVYFPQDYFQQTVAPVKKVLLVYGPNGQSRGIASVVFANAASSAKAVAELNGVKVDNRPMKVWCTTCRDMVPN